MSDDRRELLEAALDQAEEGTLEAPTEKEIEVNDDPIQAENEESSPEESNDRDEKGRFKAKEANTDQDTVEEPELVAEASDVPDEEIKRPTTWKKEYVMIGITLKITLSNTMPWSYYNNGYIKLILKSSLQTKLKKDYLRASVRCVS
jgi:hypothetical protein